MGNDHRTGILLGYLPGHTLVNIFINNLEENPKFCRRLSH